MATFKNGQKHVFDQPFWQHWKGHIGIKMVFLRKLGHLYTTGMKCNVFGVSVMYRCRLVHNHSECIGIKAPSPTKCAYLFLQ